MADTNKQALAEALRQTLAAFEPYHQNDTAGRPWLEAALAALAQYDRKLTPEDIKFRETASEMVAGGCSFDGDDIEVDDDGVVSISDEGAFVQAWLWVSNAEARYENSSDDDSDEVV